MFEKCPMMIDYDLILVLHENSEHTRNLFDIDHQTMRFSQRKLNPGKNLDLKHLDLKKFTCL